MPFQELSKRKRKDVKLEDIQVRVCLFAFDLQFNCDRHHGCTALWKCPSGSSSVLPEVDQDYQSSYGPFQSWLECMRSLLEFSELAAYHVLRSLRLANRRRLDWRTRSIPKHSVLFHSTSWSMIVILVPSIGISPTHTYFLLTGGQCCGRKDIFSSKSIVSQEKVLLIWIRLESWRCNPSLDVQSATVVA